MPRGIDQVQDIVIPVLGLVVQLDGLILDGDASFPFQAHGVQDLVLHFPFGQGPGHFNEPVGQGGFPVVDMGDDGKITDMITFCHGFSHFL